MSTRWLFTFSASPERLLGLSPYPYIASVLHSWLTAKCGWASSVARRRSAESLSEALTARVSTRTSTMIFLIFAADGGRGIRAPSSISRP